MTDSPAAAAGRTSAGSATDAAPRTTAAQAPPSAESTSAAAGVPPQQRPVEPKKAAAEKPRDADASRRPVDREFLPAALEILDTPPSPVGLGLLVAICALAVIALGWSWIGTVDVVAVASGKIQPTGRVKVVQPLEGGRVETIAVRDGQEVAAGALLMRLDPREADADVAGLSAALESAKAEALRRRAALAAVERGAPAEVTAWGADIPQDVREREARVLKGDVDRLAAQLATLDAQRVQKLAEEARLKATISAQRELLATQDTRIGMRAELLEREVGSKAQLLDAQEMRQTQGVNLRVQEGQLAEVTAALDVIERNRENTKSAFIADNAQRLADVERQIEDTRQRLVKARARLDQMTTTAPIAGTVTALAVIGPGQVVTTGEEVMRIVPEGSKLELEVYMPNRDIGFVHVGARAVVKIDSFPFTRFGTIDGHVLRIAHDAVSAPDVEQSLASPAATPRTKGAAGTQPMQNLMFPVTIALDAQSMTVDGSTVPLSPGMTAQAEVKTGQRRILEYLFSPLIEVGTRALRER
ncbi:HlyD family type I secretion periplasmic adaptor subunit [Xanthobacter variabilis]|uniref:HlyD family type I secretion periplasmic adaptor subunit n=1 Tax=Xanthobacter variabilis TaxID=3119932 RepID=UPI00372B1B28